MRYGEQARELTQDRTNDLHEWALADAKETFQDEMLAEWYWNVKVNEPPAPGHGWLANHMVFEDDPEPTEAERTIYEEAYKNCMRRAMFKLDQLFDKFCEQCEDTEADATELENEVTEACLTAMEEK